MGYADQYENKQPRRAHRPESPFDKDERLEIIQEDIEALEKNIRRANKTLSDLGPETKEFGTLVSSLDRLYSRYYKLTGVDTLIRIYDKHSTAVADVKLEHDVLEAKNQMQLSPLEDNKPQPKVPAV